MRISLSNCVLVFVVGWIGGLLFIQIFFDVFGSKGKSFRTNFVTHTNEVTDQGGVAGLISSVGKGLSFYINPATPSPTPMRGQHRLPLFSPFNVSATANATEAPYIYLDWPVDDRLFTVDNYKALESLLSVYPGGTFKCLLATSREAFTHKIGNALSYTQFSKYKKRRYNINVEPLNTKQKSRTTSLGEKYTERWYDRCCSSCNATCRATDRTQPYHLLNYIRLTHLWRTGGIFSDFSYFFLGPITGAQVQQGYQITSWCGNKHHQEQWQIASDKSRSISAGDCATSTLLVFNVPRSEALLCVLARYDDDSFVECVESDTTHGGAKCIRAAFDACFESLKLKNGLAAPEESGSTPAEDTDGIPPVVEMFGSNAFRATNTLLSVDWTLEPERRAFWLGSLAWTGSWKNYPYRNATLLGAAARRIRLLQPFDTQPAAPDQCKISRPVCSHYARNLSILSTGVSGSSSNSASFLRRSNAFTSASGSVDLSHGTGIEAASCTPSVVVAGFMKSASSFLFHTLTKHPNVLPALRGSQHKETRCYHHDRNTRPSALLDRAWCFPFVEEGEPFVSIDGTVSYDIDQYVPRTIKEDNANVKVIFVVRNPVERLYSSFKFAYNTYAKFGNFDEFIVSGMDLNGKFGDLREMLTNGTDMRAILDVYYNLTYRDAARGSLFMHSLYALPVQHYVNILGRENVKVVSAEDLDVHDPVRLYDTLNSVFRFIGVCAVPITDLVPSLPSRNTVPVPNQMSQDMYAKLTRFFRPFNSHLMAISEVNATRWNDKTPPAKLPRYSPLLNKTMPELWFEIKENAAGKKMFAGELTAHLLPQKISTEDSGYNTTLGMLNTF